MIVILIIIGIGIAIGLYYYRHHKLYYHFGAVEKGKLYRSGKLSSLGLKTVTRRFKIRTIINLTHRKNHEGTQWLAEHIEYCSNNEINLIQIPMTTSKPPNDEQIEQFIDICDDVKNYPILVHCMQGVLRTGMMVAIYQKRYLNMKNENIFKNLPSFGHDFNSKRYVVFREFVLDCKAEKFQRTFTSE